jgi:hypothetical protein
MPTAALVDIAEPPAGIGVVLHCKELTTGAKHTKRAASAAPTPRLRAEELIFPNRSAKTGARDSLDVHLHNQWPKKTAKMRKCA